jgi:hypothetical protein
MVKKTITYTDFDGNVRTEDSLFNLSRAEVIEMELSVSGGLTQMIERIASTQDGPAIFKVFKDIIMKAYGEKSPDGKRFIKSAELSEAFSQTEAYSELLMELITDPNAAAKFMNELIPKAPDMTPAAT